MNNSKNQSGTTLLETVIYLALFALLFSGAIGASYNVLELGSRNLTKTMVQQEGDFLLAKIDWVLSGVNNISEPAAGSELARLTVDKVTNLDPISGLPVTKEISISIPVGGGDMMIKYPSDPEPNTFTLSNSNIRISSLNFKHDKGAGNGIEPDSIQTTFTIATKTDTGANYSQEFSSKIYIRQ
jgi:hypothetical protein